MYQLTLYVIGLFSFRAVLSQPNPCFESSCYPATGDLMIGRQANLSTSSTCGLKQRGRYCIVSHLEERKKCFWCDSRGPHASGFGSQSHRIENIVSNFKDRKSWWQAENGKENVYIQLNLGAEFHFTHLVMTFKTFRPSAMLVERSYDFGKTWKVYRYFAADCATAFPGVPTGPVTNLKDVICESKYSDVAPSTRGEVIFRVLPPNIDIQNPYAQEVQDLLKMTNVRVNFTKLHTLGDDLLDNRRDIKEKYYYSVYDMVVRGSCSCYGHASRCVPKDQFDSTRPDMVHGKCECTHNTKGLNCETCQDFYHDLPWRPALRGQANPCKRCNCNNHAVRCHFDPAVYEQSGRQSGGICDDCEDHTMGRNCQECKPFYYQAYDDFTRRDVCRPCNCDPRGSKDDGECESRTDPVSSLRGGQCYCKPHVQGLRCDSCKNGFWNLTVSNVNGCVSCACNTLGTSDNKGCNKQTGHCICKRFVSGKNCDQCLDQYWGMNSDELGCKLCDCDRGGAYDNLCDKTNGQCRCRPNIHGRRCDKAMPAFFITSLDYLIYEAEYAKGTGNVQLVVREIIPGRPATWTGPGFSKVTEGDVLEFTVDNIPSSMEYDIVIRYEPQMRERWDDVRVTVIRPGPVDQTSVCANSIPQDDFKATALPPGNRFYVISPSSCLERGVSYTVRLDFHRYKSTKRTKEATVLIDSIVLVPSIKSDIVIKVFPPNGITDWERLKCLDQEMTMGRDSSRLSEACRQYLFSIGAIIHQRALDCQCDPTGTESAVCEELGGQCKCKPHVVGRQCDRCAPGTYGLGPQGCTPCNCNTFGSRDNFCNLLTGQCLCIPNIYSRQCDRCQRGFYNFPNCQQCQCNGHADECEDRTGRCLACRDNTAGDRCQQCVSGHYGDPRLGSLIPCRPCQCPGGASSGYQHADTCRLDPRNNDVICDCKPGYYGNRCDSCRDNYYGNPLVPGGTCQPCICNNNIDVDVPGSCDARTGQCLKCQYFTEGDQCEICQDGYFGDATLQDCRECNCYLLGHNQTRGQCERSTGQCPCFPNVVGRTCDDCLPNYWKIASGEGCETCDCDQDGSTSLQCNLFDGQCPCKPGRGGRKCDQCEANSWGNPNINCQECNCHAEGSTGSQCDRQTGQCPCYKGVSGQLCDRCDRGTTGELPNCVPCGECFDNWDDIIQGLQNTTNILVKEAAKVKVKGVSGAFENEFKQMEDNLNAVRKIVSNQNVSLPDVKALQDKLAYIRRNLTQSGSTLFDIRSEVAGTETTITKASNRLEALRRGINDLNQTATDLRVEAEKLQQTYPQGAYESIKESQNKSILAQMKVDNTTVVIKQAADKREAVLRYLYDNKADFDAEVSAHNKSLKDIDSKIDKLEASIADINEAVCDGRGQPCDTLCGGGGCGKCGGLSCDKGAVPKSENALNLAEEAEKKISQKNKEADNLLASVQAAQKDSKEARDAAQGAFDKANEAKNISKNNKDMVSSILDDIDSFIGREGTKPQDIRMWANEVLAMNISLSPDQIRDLANQINATVSGLSNIQAILNATKGDNATAHSLEDRAKNASAAAGHLLETAKMVTKLLEQANQTQHAAREAIDKANSNIDTTELHLTQIESETDAALGKSNQSLNKILDLMRMLDDVKRKYTENERSVNKSQEAATEAMAKAEQAEKDADDLEAKYKDATKQLDTKYNMTAQAKDRASLLRNRATNLAQDIETKIRNLRAMETSFDDKSKELDKLNFSIQHLLDEMKKHNDHINKEAQRYLDCTP